MFNFTTCFLLSILLLGLSYVFIGNRFSLRFGLFYAFSCILCDLHDGTEFTKCVFSKYTSYLVFDTIVSLPLWSIICDNCFKPILLLKKCQIASLLSFSSSQTESPYLVRRTTSSDFTLINFVSRLSKTKSPSPFMHCKKADNKWKTVAKEAVRNRDYNLPM